MFLKRRTTKWSWALLLLGTVFAANAPCGYADQALDLAVDRARARQDAAIKRARERDPESGVHSYAREIVERARARPNDAVALYLAGRAAFYAKKPDVAETYMVAAYTARPELWHAALSLAQLSLTNKSWEKLDHWLAIVFQNNPASPRGKSVKIQGLIARGRHGDAIPVLTELVRENPTELRMRALLAECYFRTKDAKKCTWHLEKLRGSDLWNAGPEVRFLLARAYGEQAKWDSAIVEMESLRSDGFFNKGTNLRQQYCVLLWSARRIEDCIKECNAHLKTSPKDAQIVELLDGIYLSQRQHTKRVKTLTRLRELSNDEAQKTKITKLLGAYKAEFARGLKDGDKLPTPQGTTSGTPNNHTRELIKRCIHRDVNVRREGLRAYYEYDLPFAHPIVYQRFDHNIEPDPECRVWALKILGRFSKSNVNDESQVHNTAWRVATALEDPSGTVRRVAAEQLSDLGVRAGMLYLLPYFFTLPVQNKGIDAKGKDALETEYNAARLALRTLTPYRDTKIGDDKWIKLDDAAANRDGWFRWLDGAEGAEAKLAAIEDMRKLVRPKSPGRLAHWFCKYLRIHVGEPSPYAVSRAAYRVIRDARDRIGPNVKKSKFFYDFPSVPDDKLTADGVNTVAKQLRSWWRNATLRQRNSIRRPAPRKPEAPPAGFPTESPPAGSR